MSPVIAIVSAVPSFALDFKLATALLALKDGAEQEAIVVKDGMSHTMQQ